MESWILALYSGVLKEAVDGQRLDGRCTKNVVRDCMRAELTWIIKNMKIMNLDTHTLREYDGCEKYAKKCVLKNKT
ncbi:hypothetical protein DBV15_09759 [Temnothorax longispinosus]|uniref:Uncharacterized protein n=1 Tax=Temnothorax longispinosus TaxID=300112 RepID=A0A4S2L1C6_9HYME|nr:hypothetical protein DBV15_09759 [Temnothorax longispinosus]